jgi:hypothetical protein
MRTKGRGGGQAHGIDVANARLDGRGKPVGELLDRIRIEIAAMEPARGVIVTGRSGIERCIHK